MGSVEPGVQAEEIRQGRINPVCVGIDIGQRIDPTAIALVEAIQVYRGKRRLVRHVPAGTDRYGSYRQAENEYTKLWETRFVAHFVQRLPLGTPFPDVALRITDILSADDVRDRDRYVNIDRTGIGLPVFEMVEAACLNRAETRSVLLKPIVFTGGDVFDRSAGRMGAGFVVSRLTALFQQGLVDLPDTSEGHALVDELRTHHSKVSQDGKATYGALSGRHDDLVVALALACAYDVFLGWGERVPSPWR